MEDLSPLRRKELSGLTSNEIWLLGDFHRKRVPRIIKAMGAPLKVGAVTLIELGLLQHKFVDGDDTMEITDLGKKMLETADNLL